MKVAFYTWLFLTGCHCFAQMPDESKFTHYTTVNGLSDNFITGITQDDYGYIWASTTNGLNRFDGKEMRRYLQAPGKKTLIADKLRTVRNERNKLFVYSSNGAQWIDWKRNSFITLKVSDNTPASAFQNDIRDAVTLDNGVCVITTFTGLYVFDSTGKIIFRYDHYKVDEKGNLQEGPYFGRSLVVLNQNRILHFDRKYNMAVYDGSKKTLLSIEYYKNILPGLYSLKGCMNINGNLPRNKLLFLNITTFDLVVYDAENDRILSIQPSPKQMIEKIGWSGRLIPVNDSTALLYDHSASNLFVVRVHPTNFELSFEVIPIFKKEIITAVLLDGDNRLWIGTQNGLFRQNTRQTALHQVALPYLKERQINYVVPFHSFLRHKENLFAGTYTYLPINVLDGTSYQFKKLISFERLSQECNQVWHILEYSKDTVWFGTQDGMVWYNSVNGSFNRLKIDGMDSLLDHKSITLLYKDSKGLIWIQPNWGAGIIIYNSADRTWRRFSKADKKNYLPLRVVNFITEDKEGNIWLAENGLTRWNRSKNEFDTLITSYYGFNKDNIKISSLQTDKKGNLIFCNENNGVLFYDPVAKTYRQLTTAQGLEENAAYTALTLPNNYLWIVTHNFITAVNQARSKIISYSVADSLPASLFITAYHDSIAKRMVFGYNNAITWTTDTVLTSNSKNIPFFIDAIEIVNDTSILFPANLFELSHHQNDLTIHFSALNFDNAESNRYAYRINGKEWISLGNTNVLHFSNLAPGRYELEIKYYAASDIGTEIIKKLLLVIHPPFWKTWWFKAMMVLFAVAVIYVLYKRRVAQIRQKERVDKMLAEYELKALHTQMNPHFIFNCLNSIREMILNGENKQASKYLSKFAQLIRMTLNHSSKPFVSLQHTIEYLERYLEMEHIRTDHFTSHIDVSEDLQPDSLAVPPMLIQPFIENAIWHGSGTIREKLTIRIRFLEKNNRLLCVIEDDGVGIDASLNQKKEMKSQHQSFGISNVEERIRVLNEKYNLQSGVTIKDKASINPSKRGTIVTLHLPVKNWDQ